MSNVSNSRRSQRRTALMLAPLYLAACLAVVACAPRGEVPVVDPVTDDRGAPAELVITDARICAAVAVYRVGAGAAWDQAAIAASASLRQYAELGEVPDCGVTLARAVALGIQPDQWQRALDAVDAVESGRYTLPAACQDVTHILPSYAVADAPCAVGHLAFVASW